jgi:hypothetical protein
MTAPSRLSAALAVLSACSGATGTLAVELTTAPDSHVLDAVTRLRLTLTNPLKVVESERTSRGFDLALEVDAVQDAGTLVVEGLDANGAVVACGQSPAFSVGAITARIVVYIAAPMSIAFAPRALSFPLSEISTGSLGYGIVVAGGRTSAGAPATGLAVYNAYDHSLIEGLPLPSARAGVAVGSNSVGAVYLFGGTGPNGTATGTLWRFDSTAGPRGGYTTVTDDMQLARTGQLMVSVGSDRFLVTGAPPLLLERGELTMRTDIDRLSAAGAPLTLPSGTAAAVFAGDPMQLYRAGVFEALPASAPSDATVAALPDGRGIVIGGLDPVPQHDALVVNGDTGEVAVVSNAIATARSRPSVAATSRHLIIAGGTDEAGAPIATAEVLDARTLAPITTLPILARSGMFAIGLPNDQIVIGGGLPASDQLELFTPGPPAQ